jgi:DNA ligase (NAD+)
MTNTTSDRTRGNIVNVNGKSVDNAGAFATEIPSTPEDSVSLIQHAPQELFIGAGEYTQAVADARAAARAYYDTGIETMSDAEYDQLLLNIQTYAGDNYDVDLPDELYTQVAAGQSDGGDVVHEIPMLSLDKANTHGEVLAFLEKAKAAGSPVRAEPKLDGMAVDCKYVDWKLVRVATRGSGSAGEDITERVVAIAPANMPPSVPWPGTVHIRGELVMSAADFEISNGNRVASGKPSFANPRNAVAGSVRKENPGYKTAMSFVSYGVTGTDADAGEQITAGLNPSSELFKLGVDPMVQLEEFGENRRWGRYPYPTDGIVFKMTDEDARVALGETSRAPRWAIAYKYPAGTAVTKLLGIETAVGRTGNISFTAVLEPVQLDGSVVGRATLHNVGFIKEKNIRIGSMVEIAKMNDIIPGILRVIAAPGDDELEEYVPSTVSESGLPLDMSGAIWRSTDPSESLGALLSYATSRDVFDIDGFGNELGDALAKGDTINDMGDVFLMTEKDLANVILDNGQRYGEVRAAKVYAGIQKAKGMELNRVITSLGIRRSGRTFGRRLAAKFQTMDKILDAPKSKFYEVEGVGDERADLFYQGFTNKRPVIEKMRAAGVNMGTETDAASTVKGPNVCVTGKMVGPFAGLGRTEMQELIEKNGYTAVSSVSPTTNILVSNEETSSKWKKATSLGTVEILTEKKFAEKLGL